LHGIPGCISCVFLGWLSHEPTIHGRGFALDLVGEKAIALFKGLNEAQNTPNQYFSFGSGSEPGAGISFCRVSNVELNAMAFLPGSSGT
jgi:hypothetical protein